MKGLEKRKTDPKEITNLIKGIEKYYSRIFENDGFLGYCLGCDNLAYIGNKEYFERDSERGTFVPIKTNDLECFSCDTLENNLFFASPYDMFRIYGIYKNKTIEKIVSLLDNWREKNNFSQELVYDLYEGRKLSENFEKWDMLRDSEKYEQSVNLLINQWNNFDNKEKNHYIRNNKRQVFYNSISLINNGHNNK